MNPCYFGPKYHGNIWWKYRQNMLSGWNALAGYRHNNNFIKTTFLSTEYPKTDISPSKTQNGYFLRSLHFLYIIVYVRPAVDRWLTVMGWRCRGEGCRRSPGRWRRSRRSRGAPCRAAAPGRGVRGRAVEEGGRRADRTRASATQTSWPHIIQLSRLSVLNSTS